MDALKSRIEQIIDTINALGFMLSQQHPQQQLPPWPDILAKYTVLLSQTHSLSLALAASTLENTALRPTHAVPDAALDNQIMPLLRIAQTDDVLKRENELVRRLQAAIGTDPAELYRVRNEHDVRAKRALQAVTMLKERYDWKARYSNDDSPEEGGDGNTADEDMEDENELEDALETQSASTPAVTPAG